MIEQTAKTQAISTWNRAMEAARALHAAGTSTGPRLQAEAELSACIDPTFPSPNYLYVRQALIDAGVQYPTIGIVEKDGTYSIDAYVGSVQFSPEGKIRDAAHPPR